MLEIVVTFIGRYCLEKNIGDLSGSWNFLDYLIHLTTQVIMSIKSHQGVYLRLCTLVFANRLTLGKIITLSVLFLKYKVGMMMMIMVMLLLLLMMMTSQEHWED